MNDDDRSSGPGSPARHNRRGILGKGAASFALRTISAFLALGSTVLLARFLGPAGYGVFAYVMALVSLLAIPAQVGLPQLIVRETATAEFRKDWGVLKGLWRWGNLVSLSFSAGLATLAAGVAWLASDHFESVELATLALGLILVPLVALGNLRGAALRGLHKVVLGQLPELVLRPALMIILLLSIGLGLPHTPAHAMALQGVSALLAFVIGALILNHSRPAGVSAATVIYRARFWSASIIPLATIAALHLVNAQADIIALGFFADASEVGIYRVAVQGAALVAFGLTAINMVVAPRFAAFHAAGNVLKIRRLFRQSARATLLLALPPTAAMMIFGGPILHFAFGEEYAAGRSALAILCFGQLMNAAVGPVGVTLTMMGSEREVLKGVALGATANVVLNLTLIPLLGMNGAAIASSVSLTSWNVYLLIRLRARLAHPAPHDRH